MKSWAVSICAVLLAACATAPAPPPGTGSALLRDHLFRAPSERISADDVFAISDEMRLFAQWEMAGDIAAKGSRQGLMDALYAADQLKLEYETHQTRNAAKTFAARSGNCLSLVIMTASFAKLLNVPVRYQQAWAIESWSRIGNVQYSIGHVNLSLAHKSQELAFGRANSDQMIIDFLPPQETRGLSVRVIDEATIVAMYMNNRAAEAYSAGDLDNAYGWARAGILHNPAFMSTYNTLGVIYQRHGNLAEAERVLAFALERDAANTHVMSNLVSVLRSQGRDREAQVLAQRLEQLEPDPPFAYLNRGLEALGNGDYRGAREQIAKEVARAPYNDELHYWLAVAALGMGETDRARRELAIALEYSTSRKNHDIYATKLDRLRASQVQ